MAVAVDRRPRGNGRVPAAVPSRRMQARGPSAVMAPGWDGQAYTGVCPSCGRVWLSILQPFPGGVHTCPPGYHRA